MDFISFGSDRRRDHMSGAYLFIPNGGPQVVTEANPLIRVVTGNLLHEVQTQLKNVQHNIRVVNTPGIVNYHNNILMKPLDAKMRTKNILLICRPREFGRGDKECR